jgi:Kef-type K+ transport system membrane component KefB
VDGAQCLRSFLDISDFPFFPFANTVLVVNTFAVNYYGRPYMKDVHENKLFYRTIQILYCLLIVCSTEVFIPLNDLLQLTTLPNNIENNNVHEDNQISKQLFRSLLPLDQIIQQLTFSGFITATMILDTILSFSFERTIRRIYVKATK